MRLYSNHKMKMTDKTEVGCPMPLLENRREEGEHLNGPWCASESASTTKVNISENIEHRILKLKLWSL